jgi:hypothetical protein
MNMKNHQSCNRTTLEAQKHQTETTITINNLGKGLGVLFECFGVANPKIKDLMIPFAEQHKAKAKIKCTVNVTDYGFSTYCANPRTARKLALAIRNIIAWHQTQQIKEG